MKNILSKLSLSYHNACSWKSKQKYVVIESDDWGSIRMSSRNAKESLQAKGYPIDACAFNQYDMLESETDLRYLYQVLESVRDVNGNPAVLTANNIVANPDFDRIRQSDFRTYYYEPFTNTYKRYYPNQDVLSTFKAGIKDKLIFPQFHGREHVNVYKWMSSLFEKNKVSKDAFDEHMFSITRGLNSNCEKEFLNAFEIYNTKHGTQIAEMLSDGMSIFRDTWGFGSETCIAPCYIWNEEIEDILSKLGVKSIQSGRAQIIPYKGSYLVKRRRTGQSNKFDQKYLVRNVLFEPSTCKDTTWVENAMAQVDSAFLFRTPSIISTHRVNYIGGIDINNRQRGLELLGQLIKRITIKHPDVIFLSSAQISAKFHDEIGNCIFI